jgi:hypothetical protein
MSQTPNRSIVVGVDFGPGGDNAIAEAGGESPTGVRIV